MPNTRLPYNLNESRCKWLNVNAFGDTYLWEGTRCMVMYESTETSRGTAVWRLWFRSYRVVSLEQLKADTCINGILKWLSTWRVCLLHFINVSSGINLQRSEITFGARRWRSPSSRLCKLVSFNMLVILTLVPRQTAVYRRYVRHSSCDVTVEISRMMYTQCQPGDLVGMHGQTSVYGTVYDAKRILGPSYNGQPAWRVLFILQAAPHTCLYVDRLVHTCAYLSRTITTYPSCTSPSLCSLSIPWFGKPLSLLLPHLPILRYPLPDGTLPVVV